MFHILLVEDNKGDVLLIKEALEESADNYELSVVHDGHEAILFLDKREQYEKAKTPSLILLDINLPKINGYEVLKYVKSHKDLRKIPVIMLSTSSSVRDIENSYINYANCFITKPADVSDYFKTIGLLNNFWLNTVKLSG
ncbi:MAG: response regulator [Brumimicrobium sp.]|nr:response regulator [Brumimicrobium sp.]